MQAEPSGLVDERECSAVLERHVLGNARHRLRDRVGHLGVRAPCERGVVDKRHHVLAGAESGVGRCADHLARDLGARNKWQGRLGLVLARNHERIEEVDAGRLDIDSHQAVGGLARIDVLEVHRVGSAQLVHDPGLHGPKATSHRLWAEFVFTRRCRSRRTRTPAQQRVLYFRHDLVKQLAGPSSGLATCQVCGGDEGSRGKGGATQPGRPLPCLGRLPDEGRCHWLTI